MYARILNGQIVEYPILDIRSRFPNTSFPQHIKESDLPSGFVVVHNAKDLPFAAPGKQIVETSPVLIDGKYFRNYTLVDIDDEQKIAEASIKADEIRKRRNELLAKCDWTQFKDVDEVISSKWLVYRQALRDITDQPGFPFSVKWPRSPND